MSFTPANLDGPAAAARMQSWTTFATGRCLQAVDLAYQKPASDNPGYYTYALRAWQACPVARRHTDRNVPLGAVVFLSAGANGYGHICISLGGDRVVSTDTPYGGRVGVTTITALCKRWGRTYVGWADWLMGHNIVGLTATASLNVTPIDTSPTEQDDDMSQIQYYERTGTPDPEWMIAGEEVAGGYEVTLDKNLARIWGRQYSGEGTAPVHVDRDTYIAAQAYWKARAATWEARQVKRITDALAKVPTSGGAGIVELGPKSLAVIRDAQATVITAIPTKFVAG